MNKTLLKDLSLVSLFEECAHEDLSLIAQKSRIYDYPKNKIIFVRGDFISSLYIVLKGKVKIYNSADDGRAKTLHILQDGDIFAAAVFFSPGPAPATAKTLSPARIACIGRADFDEIMASRPEMAVKILEIISSRLRRAQQHIADLSLKNTTGRLISTLNYLADDHGYVRQEGIFLKLLLTHQELADLTGTSRETVTRTLNLLKKAGLISTFKDGILIRDIKALSSFQN